MNVIDHHKYGRIESSELFCERISKPVLLYELNISPNTSSLICIISPETTTHVSRKQKHKLNSQQTLNNSQQQKACRLTINLTCNLAFIIDHYRQLLFW